MLDLRLLRADLNITQEDLAVKLDVTRPYISAIETGQKIPSQLLVMRMANLVGMTYKEFINKYGN